MTMSTTSATARAVKAYLARGWAPTPVEPRGKGAILKGWQRRRLGEAHLGLFGADRNVGLVLGAASGGLVDVDCDWPEAVELATELLPATDLVHGRWSSRHCHWWYCSPVVQTEQFLVEVPVPGRKRTVVELRAERAMTVVPPSVHPSGDRLVWESWGDPGRVEAGELRQAAVRLALAAVLVSRGWRANDAVSLVRQPADEVVRAVERPLRGLVSARAWFEGRGRPTTHRALRGHSGGQLVPGRASPFTEAILRQVGGVVGAGKLLGLHLGEGHQPCPFHGGASGRALQVTEHVWRCWAGCGAGNAIYLVATAIRVSYREARTWLGSQLGLDWRDYPSPPPR